MDYRRDQTRAEIAEIERDMRQRLSETMDMCAKFDEKVVGRLFGRDSPAGGRRPRTATERELTIALNTIGQHLRERARDKCPRTSWEGLYEAANLIENDIGRRGLPQLMSRPDGEEDEPT
jgi:hypothetical protein